MGKEVIIADGKFRALDDKGVEIITMAPINDDKLFGILKKNIKHLARFGVTVKDESKTIETDLLPESVEIPQNLLYMIELANKSVIQAISERIELVRNCKLDYHKIKSARLRKKEKVILEVTYEAKRV